MTRGVFPTPEPFSIDQIDPGDKPGADRWLVSLRRLIHSCDENAIPAGLAINGAGELLRWEIPDDVSDYFSLAKFMPPFEIAPRDAWQAAALLLWTDDVGLNLTPGLRTLWFLAADAHGRRLVLAARLAVGGWRDPWLWPPGDHQTFVESTIERFAAFALSDRALV